MRSDNRVLVAGGLLVLSLLPALTLTASGDERPRVIVLTDISNEPDDEESMVRFLVYSNELDVEGLIATTSTHLRNRTREDLIRRQIEAYRQVAGESTFSTTSPLAWIGAWPKSTPRRTTTRSRSSTATPRRTS